MRRFPRLDGMLHGLAIAVGLFATVATSQRRWQVEAPEANAAGQALDAAAPSGRQRFRIVAAPALADYDGARALVTVRGTATWRGAEPATNSVLRVTYTGVVGPDAQPVVELALRPDEAIGFEASGDVDLSTCADGQACTAIVGAAFAWEPPQGRVEIAWSASASASGVPRRRDSGPTGDGLLVVEAMP